MSGIGDRRRAPAKHRRTELHDSEKHDDGEHNRRQHLGQGHPHEHTPLSVCRMNQARGLHSSAARVVPACRYLRECVNLSYRIAIATAASATGNDQAQSPSMKTAEALTTQPKRKPTRRCNDLLKRPASTGSKRCFESKSISDKTVLVKLPVITAVEIAPGIARRRSAYWHAIAETAIITAMPAVNPRGSVDTLVVTLKSRIAASSRN